MLLVVNLLNPPFVADKFLRRELRLSRIGSLKRCRLVANVLPLTRRTDTHPTSLDKRLVFFFFDFTFTLVIVCRAFS